jgi:ABC-2 type transport system ATP-binding protein
MSYVEKNIAMTEKEVYWSRFADDFEEGSNYVIGKADMNIVLKKLAEQKDLKNTLELGCGNGIYSKVIGREASKLYATDFSDEMVSASKSRLKAFPNITVGKENCFELSYEDSSFDTVFMANLLHIIPEPEKAIAEANRVLRTGGTIIVMSYTMDGMKVLHKLGMIYRYLKTWGKPSPHARNLSLANADDMLLRQGFEIAQSELLGAKSKAIFIRAVKIN